MALHDENENPVLDENFKMDDAVREQPRHTNVNVPSISTIMSNYSNNNTLEEGKGKEYLDRVVAKLRETMGGVEVISINTNAIACRIILDAKKTMGVALLFAETYSSTDVPPTEHLAEIMTRFRRTEDAKILQTIVVAEEDYVKAHNMANHILSQISTNINAETLNIASFKSDNFTCTSDISKVRKFISDYSPHGVPARVDVGVLLSALVEKEGPVRFGENRYDEVPILAVGGYTSYTLNSNLYQFGNVNMNRAQQATNKACVNITEIVANRAFREFISIAIPIATHQFIKNNGWLNAYNTYAPHVPNLGNLVMDQETRKLSVCTNQTERDNFVMEHIQCPPYVAIDISDGRARISGLDHYAQDKSAYVLKQDIESFIGAIELAHEPIVDKVKVYDGYVKNKDGLIVDSRNIDYLYLCCNNVDLETASKFMIQPPDPATRVAQIKGVHPDMRPLYSTTKVVLHGEFISKLGGPLESSVRIKFDNVNPGMFGTSNFLSGIGQDVNNYNNFTMGGGGGHNYGSNAQYY